MIDWKKWFLENYGAGGKARRAHPRLAAIFILESVAKELCAKNGFGEMVHPAKFGPFYRGRLKFGVDTILCFWPKGAVFNNPFNSRMPRGGYLIDAPWWEDYRAKQIELPGPEGLNGNV